ncbi:hypothetical protein Gpo141_00012809 [Globisporangium polare]
MAAVMSITDKRTKPSSAFKQGIWTQDEHDKFLEALRQYPQGPWRSIAASISTRSVRQVQTHAQKYNEKVMRKLRGTHKDRKTWARLEHRIDDDVLSFCTKHVGGTAAVPRGTRAATTATKSCCDGSDEFGETDSSSSEYSSASQESQDSLEDDLGVLSWDKLHAESSRVEEEVSEWLSSDESLDFLIDFVAEVK